MKKKTKRTLSVLLTALILGGVVGGVAHVTDGFKNFDLIKDKNEVVDESRVAITMHGKKGNNWVSAYVFMQHPDLEEAYVPFAWPGIMPREVYEVDGYDYVTYNGNNSFTIELTDLLPLEYTDFSLFLDDGGSLGIVLSYMSEDNLTRIQSKDLLIEESGNHYLTLPNANYAEISDEVVKFEKVVYQEEEKENPTSNSTSINTSTNNSTSSSVEDTEENSTSTGE